MALTPVTLLNVGEWLGDREQSEGKSRGTTEMRQEKYMAVRMKGLRIPHQRLLGRLPSRLLCLQANDPYLSLPNSVLTVYYLGSCRFFGWEHM